MVESLNIESGLCRIENLQFFFPNYVVQAMSYGKSHIESRLCSPGYFVCEIADFRVQAMSSFRVQAIVVQSPIHAIGGTCPPGAPTPDMFVLIKNVSPFI
jgi:hypothetical protein